MANGCDRAARCMLPTVFLQGPPLSVTAWAGLCRIYSIVLLGTDCHSGNGCDMFWVFAGSASHSAAVSPTAGGHGSAASSPVDASTQTHLCTVPDANNAVESLVQVSTETVDLLMQAEGLAGMRCCAVYRPEACPCCCCWH